MKRAPVYRGAVTIEATDNSGDSKTIDLGLLESVVGAYGVTFDNLPLDGDDEPIEDPVALTIQLQNKEVFTKTDGDQYERWVQLAAIGLDAGEAGTLLVNGLYIGEGTRAIVTLGADATAEYDLCLTIREVL